MKVAIVEDDATMRSLLCAVVARAGHVPVPLRTGEELLALVDAGGELPRIFLLDWMMAGTDGVEVCRELRKRKVTAAAYVILITSRARRQDVIEGLAAGADDFVAKPFDPTELIARIRVGERLTSRLRPPQHPLAEVLAEARRGASGEVVVRAGETVGRIYIHDGRVAWAHLSSEPSSLWQLFEGNESAGVSADDVRAVIDECRRSGRNFAEALVEWGLLDRAVLRERLRTWLARRIEMMFKLQSPSVLFVPSARRYSSELVFDFAEVLPAELPVAHGGRPAQPSGEELSAIAARFDQELHPAGDSAAVGAAQLDELLGIAGALGAAVVDVSTGRTVATVGDGIDPDTLWSKIRYIAALHASGAGAIESLQVNTEHEHHLIAAAERHPGWYVVLVLRKSRTAVAAARAVLTVVARRL